MKIVSVGSYGVSPRFTAVNESENKEKTKIEDIKDKAADFCNEHKTSGLVIASALAAATLAGAAVHGKMNREIKYLRRTYQQHIDGLEAPFRRQIEELENNLTRKTTEATTLKENNEELFCLNRQLNNETEAMKTRLDEVLNEDLPPESVRTRLYEDLKGNVEKELDYDPLEPPVTGKASSEADTEKIKRVTLPERKPTTNRSHFKELDIPEIKDDGSFEYQVPYSDDVKVTKMESVNFTPRKNVCTNVSESYADSVQWDNNKIARDVLQNFFDGHGQTLDGVRLKFISVEGGRFKIRIEGDSSYTVDKAILIGESTKRDNAKAAGNYGEGLKMSVLKLLRDKGAKEVKIGSDNWDLTYKLSKDDITDKRVLAYDLDKVAQKHEGNFIEFETEDRDLLDVFRTSINRFYHSGNVDFKCPDYENDFFGIKLLKPKTIKHSQSGWYQGYNDGEKGGLYIAGQRFEFDGDYRGLEGATIFLKEKPPKQYLDPSRDRTTLNKSNLRSIMQWEFNRMSKEEKVKFIAAMEPLWKQKGFSEKMDVDEFFQSFLNQVRYTNGGDGALLIDFPKDKYVAFSDATSEVVEDLMKKGYTVCDEKMSYLGMQTIRDLLGDARAHTPLQPSKAEMKKINIIKEALKKLSKALEKEKYSENEIDTKIYMFDRNADAERRMSEDTLAEALVDKMTSKGFWIDKGYLQKGKLGEVLETALHELSHVAGGDESSSFSYKLTSVNKQILEQILEDPQTREELKILNRLWNEATNEALHVE